MSDHSWEFSLDMSEFWSANCYLQPWDGQTTYAAGAL